MTFRRWAIFLAVCLAVFLAFELWAYFSGAPTLSQSIWAWNDAMPVLGTVVSFSVGFLFGHFFWARRVIVLSERTYGDERLVRETKTLALVDEPYDAAFDAKSLKEYEGPDAGRFKQEQK